MTEEEADIGETSQYPYSVKIQQTTYGARVSVHAYDNIQVDACDGALEMYHYTRHELIKRGYIVAPEEAPKPKKNDSQQHQV